jgi:Putative beta barrel porin-7 (BBP7)
MMCRRVLGALGGLVIGGGVALAQRPIPVAGTGAVPDDAPIRIERPVTTPYGQVPNVYAPLPRVPVAPARAPVRKADPFTEFVPETGNVAAVPPPPVPPPPLAQLPPPDGGAPVVMTGDVAQPGDDFGRYFYGSADYLLFDIRRGPSPQLVQVIPPSLSGVDELPPGAAFTVFGARGVDPGSFNGVRGQFGVWLGKEQTVALEADYFKLFRETDQFTAVSQGVPVIGRGFVESYQTSSPVPPATTPVRCPPGAPGGRRSSAAGRVQTAV